MYNQLVLNTEEIVKARIKSDDIASSVLERTPWTKATYSIIVVIFSFS